MATGDLENQGNGHTVSDETKLAEEKVPEVKVASPAKQKPDQGEFQGLTKEELLQYANDPSWVRLRWALFILFWLVWLAMLVASVVIIVFAPKCPSPEPKDWWQKGPIYKVDLRTFKDSDGDGVGDINGLVNELDYLVDTGINTIFLSSIFNSKTDDSTGELGVVDFMAVDPTLGTMADWDTLVAELESRNIKVIIDVPDKTSESHEWFQKAAVNQDPAFLDYYTKEGPPPQLNLKNPKVVSELESVLTFWTDKGVDGFNMEQFNNLVENDVQGSKELIKNLRRVADEEPRVIVSLNTGLPLSEVGVMYGDQEDPVAENHVGVRFNLVGSQAVGEAVKELSAASLKEYIGSLSSSLPANAWPTIYMSSPDQRTGATYPDMVDGFNMLSLILPATPIVNSGDELGQSTEGMNWDMQANQTKATAEGRLTHYSVFSKLKDLRHQEAILFGDMWVEDNNNCLVVVRVKKGNPGYILIINMQDMAKTIDVSKMDHIAENIRILTSSTNGQSFSLPDPEAPKSYPSVEVPMEAKQARMFTFVPVF